ncbi:MAG: glucose/galactose MFS transporter, partial [Proteobacteria bacterium]|nr:glucose/galactose MFS transporter [Pseudomonadota bacterium]
SQTQALMGSAVAGCLCIVGVLLSSESSSGFSEALWGWIGVPTLPDPIFFVALMGTANALVWPSIWPLALNGLGRHTALGSALLIMGVSGGAIIPLAFGKIASDLDSLQIAYSIGIPCYLFVLFYAIKGHKMRRW